jgi:hypothetical protein
MISVLLYSCDFSLTLIHGLILISPWQISHLLERYHINFQLVVVLYEQVLRIIWSIEVGPCAILSWASMVSSNDEVGGAKVLTDDGVPDRFSWSTHAHGKGKECEMGHSIRVFCHNRFVDTDAAA